MREFLDKVPSRVRWEPDIEAPLMALIERVENETLEVAANEVEAAAARLRRGRVWRMGAAFAVSCIRALKTGGGG